MITADTPLARLASFAEVREAAARFEAAKAHFLREDAAFDVLLCGDFDAEARDDMETIKLDPARAAMQTSHRRLCALLKDLGYSALVVGGRCYVGFGCDDINECDSIEFPASRLLNLDAETERGRS